MDFDDRLIGAIVAIKLAQSQKMISDEAGSILIDVFMRTHGLPSGDDNIARRLVTCPQTVNYCRDVNETCK